MTKKNARVRTPSPSKRDTTAPVVGDKNNNPSTVFFSMAMDMSWRLAIVVLVPIIGGFELDKHLHTSPWLTILGFILAITGTLLVMRQIVKAASLLPVPKKERHP